MENPFIQKLQSLSPLTDATLNALQRAMESVRKVDARHDLIREGDEPGPVFVMLEGWACRYKILPNGSRQVTAFLMPGDACDLNVGLLTQMDHSIQTLSKVSYVTIGREKMSALLSNHADFSRAMYIAQLTDEGVLRAWITSMGRRTSIERVAHLTCELYVRATATRSISNGRLELPLSQSVLADALGMTPVHINRVLKDLRERGVMETKRGAIIIVDALRLVEVAGFDENYLHRRGLTTIEQRSQPGPKDDIEGA